MSDVIESSLIFFLFRVSYLGLEGGRSSRQCHYLIKGQRLFLALASSLYTIAVTSFTARKLGWEALPFVSNFSNNKSSQSVNQCIVLPCIGPSWKTRCVARVVKLQWITAGREKEISDLWTNSKGRTFVENLGMLIMLMTFCKHNGFLGYVWII